MAERPSIAFHDGRRSTEHAKSRASRRAFPARRCSRFAARPRAGDGADAHAAGTSRRQGLSMAFPDPDLLSLNTATVRAQWKLPDIIAGCVRHGIRGIAPWRDQVAATGLAETAQRIRDAGLTVTGLCRGGMFPAVDREGRRAALDDNRRAIDEALTIGAHCLPMVVDRLPQVTIGIRIPMN